MFFSQSRIPRDHTSIRRKKFGYYIQSEQEKIDQTLRPIQDKRGPDNETMVGKILEEYKQQGLIRHFYRSDRGSRQDRKGIDFMVTRNDSSRIILQVKSSQRNIEKFIKKGEELKNNRYDGLFCILVKTDYLVDDQPLRDEIKNIVSIEE